MTFQSSLPKSKERDRADFGFARARDLAFDAIQSLWSRRRKEGMKQIDLAKAVGRDPAWVNRNLHGPGNWTLRTFGELVEALDGEIEISVEALEDPLTTPTNYHAYQEYDERVIRIPKTSPVPVSSPVYTSTVNPFVHIQTHGTGVTKLENDHG